MKPVDWHLGNLLSIGVRLKLLGEVKVILVGQKFQTIFEVAQEINLHPEGFTDVTMTGEHLWVFIVD